MDILVYLLILILYGLGMYICGYRKALKKAMDDMDDIINELTEALND